MAPGFGLAPFTIIGTGPIFPFMAGGKKRCPRCDSQMEERDMVCSCKRVDFLGTLKDDNTLLAIVVGVSLLVLAVLVVLAFG